MHMKNELLEQLVLSYRDENSKGNFFFLFDVIKKGKSKKCHKKDQIPRFVTLLWRIRN